MLSYQRELQFMNQMTRTVSVTYDIMAYIRGPLRLLVNVLSAMCRCVRDIECFL